MEESLDELYNECYKLKRQKKWDEALKILEKCRRLDPRHPLIHAGLIEIYSLRGRVDDVVQEHLRYIEALSLREEFDKARTIITQALIITSNREEIVKKLIGLFRKNRLMNEFYKMVLLLVQNYLDRGMKKQAGEILYKIHRAGPEDFEVRMEMARLFGEFHEQKISMEILQEILFEITKKKHYHLFDKVSKNIRKITGSQSVAHMMLGKAYHRIYDFEKAALQYSEAIRLNRQNIWALLGIANILFLRGKYTLAIKTCQKVLDLSPEEPMAFKEIARSYYHTGESCQAIFFLMALSKIYLINGKYTDAYSIFREILFIDEHNSKAIEEIKKLIKSGLITERDAERVKPSLLRPAADYNEEIIESYENQKEELPDNLQNARQEKLRRWEGENSAEQDLLNTIDSIREMEIEESESDDHQERKTRFLDVHMISVLPTKSSDPSVGRILDEEVHEKRESFLPSRMIGVADDVSDYGELPDDPFLKKVIGELIGEQIDMREGKGISLPSRSLEQNSHFSSGEQENSSDYLLREDISSLQKPPADIGVVKKKVSTTNKARARPIEILDNACKFPDKVYWHLDRLAANIVFYETPFVLGLISMKGQLIWISRSSNDEMLSNFIDSSQNLVTSLLRYELFSRKEKLSCWIAEFENSTFFLHSIDSDINLFMIINSTESVDKWKNKLKAIQKSLKSGLK